MTLAGHLRAGHEPVDERRERERLITLHRMPRARDDLDFHGRQSSGRLGEVLRRDENTVTAAYQHDGHAWPGQVIPERRVASLGRANVRVIAPRPTAVR